MKSTVQILSHEIINELKKLFGNFKPIIACYLFGSRATYYKRQESDLDLAVIVDDRNKCNEFELNRHLARIAFPYEIDLSLVDFSSSPYLLFQIIKNGKCLYQRSLEERINFEARILHEFYDSQHRRNIYYYYLDRRLKENRYGRR